jgi:hypothetical protein
MTMTMDTGTLLNIVTAAVVVVSPLLTSVFTHTGMTSRTKNTIAMIVSLVIAVVYEVLTGGIADWTNILIAFPVVYGLQQAVYNTLLKALATSVEATVGVAPKADAGTVQAVTTQAADGSEVVVAEPVEETPAMG